jgi:antitoxin component YwqK of YwqJK toxin-antitoxin module/peroxiredoxin
MHIAPTRISSSTAALLVLAACATPVPFEEKFASGAVKSSGEMMGRAQVGDWNYYWENGRPRARGHYEKDLQVGPWTWWHDNGNKSVTGSFRDEHSDGEWRYWHPNGKPHMTGFFDRGRKTGEWSVFDGDGRLAERGHYATGKRTGHWDFRHATGRPKADGWFRDGAMIGTWSFFNESGQRSTKRYPLPDGVTIYGETWGDGTLRRVGLLERGAPHGRWITWHDNGVRRISGDFDRGRPVGPWRAFSPDGKVLAFCRIDAAHPRGVWTFVREGDHGQAADAAARPPAVWSGVWSRAREYDATAALAGVERWFQEARSPCAANAWESMPGKGEPPAADAAAQPSSRAVDAVTVVPREPMAPPILTRRELESMGTWLKAYTEELVTDAFDIYRRSRGPSRRDAKRSDGLVGKALDHFEFAAPDGTRLALGTSGERWTLLVVLRGFAGQVCPYCPVQLRALAPFRAEFEELGVRVVAVYPGPRTGLDGFFKAYSDTFGRGMKPPYTIFYDVESRLTRELGVLETDPESAILARPTTLLLDEQARVRYSYVGRHRGDRPAAKSLLDKIRGFRAK